MLNRVPATSDPTSPDSNQRLRRAIDIVIDGTEDDNGRALFVISALHLAAGALNPARIWVLAPSAEMVSVAAEALAWDANLSVTCLPADPNYPIMKSGGVAVTASTWEPNWPFIAAAYRAGLAAIAVVQFPRLAPELTAHFPHIRSAHDTTILAGRIAEELAVLHT